MSIVFSGFLCERWDKTAKQDGEVFLSVLYGNFLSQDVKTRKDKRIYASSVCAGIIISKEHGIVKIIP